MAAGDFNEEDLKLILTVDPDTTAVNKALKSMSKEVDAISAAGSAAATSWFDKVAAGFKEGGVGSAAATAGGVPAPKDKGGGISSLLAGVLGGQGGGISGQLGAMAGEAIGGPVGAVVGEMVAKSVQTGLEMPAKLISGGFKLIGSSLNELGNTLGPIGLGLSLASDAAEGFVGVLSTMSPILGAVVGPLAEVPGALKGILETLVGFSAKASPVSVQMFQFAVEDLQAVIGGSFLPVLEMMTQGVRLVGDALATILPNSVEVRQALSEVRGALSEAGTAVRQALAEAGPAIRKDLIDGLKMLSEAAAITIRALVAVGEWVKENWDFIMVSLTISMVTAGLAIGAVALAITVVVSPLILLAVTIAAPFIALGVAMYGVYRGVKSLLQMFGLIEASAASATGEVRSSVGAASRSGKIEGIEEYQRSLQLDALSAPGSASMSQMPTMVSQIVRWTESFTIDNLVRRLESLVPNPVSSATEAVRNATGLRNLANVAFRGVGNLF